MTTTTIFIAFILIFHTNRISSLEIMCYDNVTLSLFNCAFIYSGVRWMEENIKKIFVVL